VDIEWQTRQQCVLKYLRGYQASLKPGFDWVESYARTDTSWIEKLPLIHPDHYTEFVEKGTVDPRGSFPRDEEGLQPCQSKLLWGYDCPFVDGDDGAPQQDHLFPFNCGGPSWGNNMRWLCRYHNSMKSCDLHIYPWERGEPIWFREILERVRRIVGNR
jgi:hypothetical protein